MKIQNFAAIVVSCFLIPQSVFAHNVWCHGSCDQDPLRTVEFYRTAGDVYLTLEKVKRAWSDANVHLEHGVIAEFEYKLDPQSQLKAHEFTYALEGYLHLSTILSELDDAIERLQAVDKKCAKVKKYEAALGRILADGRQLPRLTKVGVRYADAAGLPDEAVSRIEGTTTILAAWRSDLSVLRNTLDEVTDGLRNAIPLAERGQFAEVMLSGRNAFGDKMPQFTDMFSSFERLYVMTVTSTIQATMEVYPTGYGWLTSEAVGK